eukprot:TRINITY_DN3570_c0_g1_i1.p1 TRINITY_DN3570_c0_g1~~TRINITY_DN3570_c0_g1_i1.p1  ORF type:complete len:250 (+),score=28.99 TRINITY_DN3570_c0_g1_i1:68-817(+)
MARLHCAGACLKRVLIAVNLITLVIGCALVGFGVYSYKKGASIKGLQFSSDSQLPIAVIALGGILGALSLLGFCASCTESRCLLAIFAVLFFFVLLGEGALGITAYAIRNDVGSKLDKGWNTSQEETKIDIQNNFHCCGWNSLEQRAGDCEFNETCSTKVVEFVQDHLLYIGIAVIIVASFQLVTLVATGCLYCFVGAKRRRELDDEEEALVYKSDPERERRREEAAHTRDYYRQKYGYFAQNPTGTSS